MDDNRDMFGSFTGLRRCAILMPRIGMLHHSGNTFCDGLLNDLANLSYIYPVAVFTSNFSSFFEELEQNNHKTWFDENRKRYEEEVKKPFKSFVDDLSSALQPLYPHVNLGENTSLMRINRDIRFSADKTPYKIHMAAMIMPGGIKDKTRPGLYVQANHLDIRVYSGVHVLEKDQLQAIRSHIAQNLKQFNKLVTDPQFEAVFSKILGEKNKRLSAEFQEIEKEQPLIANKNFYWYFKLPPDSLLKDDLVQQLVTKYRLTLPLNQFFDSALGEMNQ